MATERLVSLRISNGALKGDTLPARIKVLGWGRNESVIGTVLFDEKSVEALNANQRKLGHDRVALDYEHNCVVGSEEYIRTKEPREVAAFGTVEAVAGDGLYLRDLTWTPSGLAHAKNYEDLSLAPKLDAEGRVVFVHSAALTRNGAVYDLSFFSADGGEKKSASLNDDGTFKGGFDGCVSHFMETEGLERENAEKLCAYIGRRAGKLSAPTEPITTLLNLMADDNKLDTIIARLDALEKRPDLSAQITTLNTGMADLQKKIQAGLDAASDVEKGKVIALFAADGKVPLGADGKPITDEDLRKFDLPTLRLLHANTPVTVPLSTRGKVAAKQGTELKGLERTAAAINEDLKTRGLI